MEKVHLGNQAQKLLKSDSWDFFKGYISTTIERLNDELGRGVKPEIEDGIIIKSADEVYRECVGKISALKGIKTDLNRMVIVKNKLEQKYEKNG